MNKILIKGKIEIKTGIHIGGDDSFSAIGAIDSTVIKNSSTNNPIIPGSSLKGKLRVLLAKNITKKDDIALEEEPIEIKRLFGSTENKSRLIFSDLDVSEEFRNEFNLTEEKIENSISRKDCKANPRKIERVKPGVIFNFVLTYNIVEPSEIEQDFSNIVSALKLLETDFLGGGGSRGNGKLAFKDLKICEDIETEITTDTKEIINSLLNDVCEFGQKIYQ